LRSLGIVTPVSSEKTNRNILIFKYQKHPALLNGSESINAPLKSTSTSFDLIALLWNPFSIESTKGFFDILVTNRLT
jgi:hypothetical protein